MPALSPFHVVLARKSSPPDTTGRANCGHPHRAYSSSPPTLGHWKHYEPRLESQKVSPRKPVHSARISTASTRELSKSLRGDSSRGPITRRVPRSFHSPCYPGVSAAQSSLPTV